MLCEESGALAFVLPALHCRAFEPKNEEELVMAEEFQSSTSSSFDGMQFAQAYYDDQWSPGFLADICFDDAAQAKLDNLHFMATERNERMEQLLDREIAVESVDGL